MSKKITVLKDSIYRSVRSSVCDSNNNDYMFWVRLNRLVSVKVGPMGYYARDRLVIRRLSVGNKEYISVGNKEYDDKLAIDLVLNEIIHTSASDIERIINDSIASIFYNCIIREQTTIFNSEIVKAVFGDKEDNSVLFRYSLPNRGRNRTRYSEYGEYMLVHTRRAGFSYTTKEYRDLAVISRNGFNRNKYTTDRVINEYNQAMLMFGAEVIKAR